MSAALSGHIAIENDVAIGAVIVNGLPAKPLRVGCGTQARAGALVTTSMPARAVAGEKSWR
jgi:hypothetical protein